MACARVAAVDDAEFQRGRLGVDAAKIGMEFAELLLPLIEAAAPWFGSRESLDATTPKSRLLDCYQCPLGRSKTLLRCLAEPLDCFNWIFSYARAV